MMTTTTNEATSQTPRRTRTLVVDDHALYRVGLRLVLQRHADLVIVGEAGSGVDALALAAQLPIDVALVDLHMPVIGGVALTRLLRRENPGCRVLVLSATEEPFLIAQALDAGASGYVFKTQDPDDVADAIRATVGGLRYLPPGLDAVQIEKLGKSQAIEKLSVREREILHMLVAGRTNDEIASSLFIARRTVETHRQRIMKKLGAHTIAELVHLASRYGLVS